MSNTDSPDYVRGYIKGYSNGWQDHKKLATIDLWKIHNQVLTIDPDLAELVQSAISRIEKIKSSLDAK